MVAAPIKRGISDMKKVIAILFIAVMTFSTAACQKTPESPIVVGKDYETMIEQAKIPNENSAETILKDAVQAPDTFVFDYSGNSLFISSNVQLNLPDVSKAPIFQAAPRDFTLEQALMLVDNLLPDAQELIQDRNELTKSELEARIIQLKQRKTLPEYSSEEDQDDIESAIKYYAELMLDAPQHVEKRPFDRTFQTQYITDGKGRTAGQYTYMEVWDTDSDIQHRLYLRNSDTLTDDIFIPDEGDGSLYLHRPTATVSFSAEGVDNIFGVYGATFIRDFSVTPEGCNLEKSPADAKNEAEHLLRSIGCDAYRLGGMMLINNSNKDKKEATQWAYELFYFPSYEGIELAPTIDSVDEELFHAPLHYEKIKMRINDAGIQSFTWDAPYEIVSTKVEDAHLLPFEDIQDIFSKMMLVKYEPMTKLENSQDPLSIEITKAGLYYVLMPQQNDISNTLLVPVWAFYGYRSWDWIEVQGITYGLYEQPILMINAIDGSIIDLAKGY